MVAVLFMFYIVGNNIENRVLVSLDPFLARNRRIQEVKKMLAEARDGINLGKALLKKTHERGSTLKPIMSECALIKDVVQPAITHVNKYITSPSWEITHSLGNRDYVIYVDPALARESIINILNNAVWAVSHDRRITRKKVFVIIRLLDDEENVKIEIFTISIC